jgi:glycosyltransferase involved in cell wall biosynthesis
MTVDETIYRNARAGTLRPRLTIASPYFRDDPGGWMRALSSHPLAAGVEALVVDDGTGDPDLDARVRAAVDAWPGPATMVRFHRNRGRATARNRLIAGAGGEYILFVDADMMPGDSEYIERYMNVVDRRSAAIVFGGFTTHGAPLSRDTRLHHNLSERSDCRPAIERTLRGAYAVASNNLLVRADVLKVHPFDDGFIGWGWEDTEWAVRATDGGYGLLHIDNPAVHVGLDTTDTVLKKYREAGRNLRRMVDRHPWLKRMRGVKVAHSLARLPFHAAFRPVARWVASDPAGLIPMPVRRMAIKYWRASWAADALSGQITG